MPNLKNTLPDFLIASFALHNPKSDMSGYGELEILDLIYEQKKAAVITAISSELRIRQEEAREKLYDLLELLDESEFPDKDYGKLIASSSSTESSSVLSFQIEPNPLNDNYLREKVDFLLNPKSNEIN